MTQMFASRASDTVSIAPAVVFQPAHTHGSQSNVNSFAGQRGDRAYAVSSGPRNGRVALRSKEARANSHFVLLWRPDIFTAGSGAATGARRDCPTEGHSSILSQCELSGRKAAPEPHTGGGCSRALSLLGSSSGCLVKLVIPSGPCLSHL